MIFRNVIILKGGNKNIYLKVDGHFSLYFKPGILDAPPMELGDLPVILEIEIKDGFSYPKKKSYSSYGYDSKTKKLILSKSNLESVPMGLIENEFRNNLLSKILRIITLTTDDFVFMYPNFQGWFVSLSHSEGRIKTPEYGQLFYYTQNQYVKENPSSLYNIEEYRTSGDPVIFRIHNQKNLAKLEFVRMSDIYKSTIEAKPEIQDTFFKAVSLYYQFKDPLEKSMNVKFISLVTCIETLIDCEYKDYKVEKCQSCEQPIYQVSRKFHDFINKYCYEYDKKTINAIYSLRSKIAHSGYSFQRKSYFFYETLEKEQLGFYIDMQIVEITARIAKIVLCQWILINSKGITDPIFENVKRPIGIFEKIFKEIQQRLQPDSPMS